MFADPNAEDRERRVLLIAPTSKDAAACREVLGAQGVSCLCCRNVEELCREAADGLGAVVVTEEAVLADHEDGLAALLRDQPPWSDIPLFVLTSTAVPSPKRLAAIRALGHTTLLRRPLTTSAFLSAVSAALRDRIRQYEARDHFEEQVRQADLLREARDSLDFALDAGRFGAWELNVRTGAFSCSPACKRNFGLPSDAVIDSRVLFDRIHPEDRERVVRQGRQAVTTGEDSETEFRVVWDEGSVHWLQLRGRAVYDGKGGATRMAGVTLDVTELKKSEEALRTSVGRLEEEDRRKNEFLAMLAHELRNPLAAISNAAQVARLGQAQEQREWAHGVIGRHVRHLSRMIDDLLDASRITRGAVDLRRQPLRLETVLHSALESARPFMLEKSHALGVEIDPHGPPMWVEGDATRLEQVFVNLLNNAAKYTDSGGTVQLEARIEGTQVVVRVTDSGVGMTPEFLARSFDLFVQGDRSAARSEGGLGIGLTLVKRLVEMHGGVIKAFSEGPGMGSEFFVSLPLIESEEMEGGEAVGTSLDGVERRTARALVVDDNEDMASSMAMLLSMIGHDVVVAHDGPSALAAARSHRPGVVLLDIGLPVMDGFEVARNLRAEGFHDALLIAVSGYGQDDDRLRSKAAGFNHHLVKPVDLDALVALLKKSDA